MRKLTIVASFSAIALPACGSPEPATDNLDTANLALNVMVANEVAAANDVAAPAGAETEAELRVAPAPAPAPTVAAKPAPKPPAPKPAEPKPAEPKPAEPKPDTDPDCAPEHRAAGHC